MSKPNAKDSMRQGAARVTQRGINQDVTRAARLQSGVTDNASSIDLSLIVASDEVQVRVNGLDEDRVEQYAAMLEAGAEFDPVVVFEDAQTGQLYLADGFHRLAAHQRAGVTIILAQVKPGGLRGALDYAESANLEHGLNLTNDDKRNILFRRLARGYWTSEHSNREIGRVFGVAHTTIKRWLDDYAEWRKNEGGANAPLAEEYGKLKKASKRFGGTRQANKKRGPTTLQLQQRAVRDLGKAAESLRRLDLVDQARWIEKLSEELELHWQQEREDW